MSYKQIPFMAYLLYAESLNHLPSKPKLLVNTINQYSFCMAEMDKEFKEALVNCDILLPDGVGVVASVKLLTGKKISKIAGEDLFFYYLNEVSKKSGKCFFLGSSELTLEKIKTRLAKDYPTIQAGFFSPPFKPEFDQQDSQRMLDAINAFQPDVLFIGMTAPKQEKWAYHQKEKIHANVICSIGAVFDFYAGTVSRPGRMWINLGFEWLIRLLKEPKRMWKRYLLYGPVFVFTMLKGKFQEDFH